MTSRNSTKRSLERLNWVILSASANHQNGGLGDPEKWSLEFRLFTSQMSNQGWHLPPFAKIVASSDMVMTFAPPLTIKFVFIQVFLVTYPGTRKPYQYLRG